MNNRNRNFSKAKLRKRLEQIDDSIARYLGEIASADRREGEATRTRTDRLQNKIVALKEEIQSLKKLEVRMLESPDQQISLTDPDARVMSTAARSKAIVGYNVQAAVETKHHLIVAHEVTNVGHDRSQLSSMALQAKEVINCDELAVVADRGYFSGEEILSCDQADITAYVPKTQTSNNQARGLFGRGHFIYHPYDNEYECPAGERLIYRFTNQEDGKTQHHYSDDSRPDSAHSPSGPEYPPL